MANYAVTDWVSAVGSAVAVAALMETYLETVDDSKTLHSIDVIRIGSDNCQAIIIHEA